jgi:hypothetical protein
MMSTFLTILLAAASLAGIDGEHVYQFSSIRAAPGTLLEVIELLQQRNTVLVDLGYDAPQIMRHSQGDHWDLLVITPIGQMGEYYEGDRTQTRDGATSAINGSLDELIAWQEDVFVTGPEPEVVIRHFETFEFYHVEMMVSAPGKRADLYHEREMENDYSRRVGRPENLIFDRVTGAAWEVITIGFYRDIQHFAEGTPDYTDEEKEEAAIAAGFEARDRIGTYLRSLMSYHNDTLAGAVQ